MLQTVVLENLQLYPQSILIIPQFSSKAREDVSKSLKFPWQINKISLVLLPETTNLPNGRSFARMVEIKASQGF